MPGTNLTREEAMTRSDLIQVENYEVYLDLTKGDRIFGSETTIKFTAQKNSATFADLIADNIHEITLNGESLAPEKVFSDSRIALSGLQEENTLTVKADCLYMHTGEGLHRFVDPVDGEAYTYSQFEVPDARRVYTTFEQPNLKATYTFTVRTPKHWTVFSNSPTPEPHFEGDSAVFEFSESEKISTYITAIVAGPYVGRTGELTSADGRVIPLGVYCRPSLEKYLDAEEIMDITRRGFEFFENEYGCAYPFRKYDQIFVPEYNAGAMENAGCVTFRDEMLFRATPSEAQVESRANTILHELAHMWFGDLVTMKWWNDLWLNESFAEYMSHLALAEATRWTDSWTGFTMRKDWGMNQDQLPSTHPIVAPIRDLQDVEVNFDGITYAKGAAVLRQLASYVGREAFTEGLRAYFKKHSWSNTVVDDLLNELEAASGRDLSTWAKVWLEEAGVNLMRPEVEVDGNGNYTSVKIRQESFNAGASLRPHRMAVGGYNLNAAGTEMERVFHIELDVTGDLTEVPELVGQARPDVLLLNDGDLTYTKLRLDEYSLENAQKSIDKFTDPLTRSIIMASAWDMTRDAELSPAFFARLVLRELTVEDNSMVMTLQLRNLAHTLSTFVAPADRRELFVEAADALRALAENAKPGSDAQLQTAKMAISYATNEEQLAWVKALHAGEVVLPEFDVNVEIQWALVQKLVAAGVYGEAEIRDMEKEDPTLTGKQRAAGARAQVPTAEVKKATYEACMHDQSLPNDTRINMMRGLWAQAALQPELYSGIVVSFFQDVKNMWESNTHHTAETIALLLFPAPLAGQKDGLEAPQLAAKAWLVKNTEADTSAALIRLISERLDAVERSLRVQAVK
ncbi:aminopeptidase N [Boudabousia liubingyangii]|uniref:Aminopeptidase N n=1 Tax=Boudabousia liubingyangii TaxID=1921764 RepID=A0A1Q5PQF1_9ACTO|nr:aminopeptidase N [Boudabousia liubingyangii]OKL49702.1 aminopeptidase N [Boudabousia liubingyangii]